MNAEFVRDRITQLRLQKNVSEYKMSYDFVVKSTDISEENKKLFLGENARKFYGFGDIPTPKKVKNMVED
jgi:hypothetical protein